MSARLEQERVNTKAMIIYQQAMREIEKENPSFERLRSCTAWVCETSHYWVLKSYNTFVAVTAKDTGICYDVLRIVYGYTNTSAQHIAKFKHDYKTNEYKWCAPVVTAR